MNERVILACRFIDDATHTRLAEHHAALDIERDQVAAIQADATEIGRVDDRQFARFGIPCHALQIAANGMDAKGHGGPVALERLDLVVVGEGRFVRSSAEPCGVAIEGEQRFVAKESFVGTVLTNPARQGIFRFFPGVDNTNVLQAAPTVDRSGNPLPPTSTAQLQSINLFSYDANRSGFDPTGYMGKLIARMPAPNDFTVGDGVGNN